MITVKYLKERLAKVPEDALAYAYEGEVSGIVIVAKESSSPLHKTITIIHADERDELQDDW